jgi:hypothetical protein
MTLIRKKYNNIEYETILEEFHNEFIQAIKIYLNNEETRQECVIIVVSFYNRPECKTRCINVLIELVACI